MLAFVSRSWTSDVQGQVSPALGGGGSDRTVKLAERAAVTAARRVPQFPVGGGAATVEDAGIAIAYRR